MHDNNIAIFKFSNIFFAFNVHIYILHYYIWENIPSVAGFAILKNY